MNKPNNVMIEGIVGSRGYGLDTKDSDTDYKGIYILPTVNVLSMGFNLKDTTIVSNNPDATYYEVAKYMELTMKGNPTCLELLFLEDYTILTPVGKLLVDNRDAFLSTDAIRNAYSGYAYAQTKKLATRTEQGLDGYASALKNRYAKHTRHLVRLMMQCKQLLETGTLTVKVTPEQREYIFKCGELSADEVVNLFIELDKELQTIESVLPPKPDVERLNKLLYDIRIQNTLDIAREELNK